MQKKSRRLALFIICLNLSYSYVLSQDVVAPRDIRPSRYSDLSSISSEDSTLLYSIPYKLCDTSWTYISTYSNEILPLSFEWVSPIQSSNEGKVFGIVLTDVGYNILNADLSLEVKDSLGIVFIGGQNFAKQLFRKQYIVENRDGKYGFYVDSMGLIISTVFDTFSIDGYIEGVYLFKNNRDSLFQIYDKKLNKIVPSSIKDYSRVKLLDSSGYFLKTDAFAINAQGDTLRVQNDGVLMPFVVEHRIEITDRLPVFHHVSQQDYLSRVEKGLVPGGDKNSLKGNDPYPITEVMRKSLVFEREGKYGVVNSYQGQVLEPKYDNIRFEADINIIYFQQNRKWGFINLFDTEIYIKPEFDYIKFSHGLRDSKDGKIKYLFEVYNEDEFFYIDDQGDFYKCE